MRHARIKQRNFFDPAPDQLAEPFDTAENAAPCGEPIAILYCYMTKSNDRCQRLAHRPVMLAGHQMTCRGRPMLFCDPGVAKGLASTIALMLVIISILL